MNSHLSRRSMSVRSASPRPSASCTRLPPSQSDGPELERAMPSPSFLDEKNVFDKGKETAQEVPQVTPYSIFTKREKWIIVGLAALGGFFRCWL